MASSLSSFSDQVAAVIEQTSGSVAAVQGRQRFDSTGIFWQTGVLVTASHTVQRDEDLRVTTPDGKAHAAELAGRDQGTDLAVLKVEGLQLPRLAEAPAESVKPGTVALLAGRNAETGTIAAMGVISGVGKPWRTWRGGKLDRFVRLDLSVFPAAAGGAVVDTSGRFIGLATTALTRVLPVAVTPQTIERVVEQILEGGRVRAGFLGVGIQPVAIPDSLRGTLNAQSGLILLSVQPGGPADKSGLLLGDVLLRLDGNRLESHEDLQEVLGSSAAGKALEAEILRSGQAHTLRVVAGERPHRS